MNETNEAGLIAKEQPPEGRDDLTAEQVSSQIKMPAELQEAYERVVLAGMKLLFSKETNKAVIGVLQAQDGDLAERLGKSIAGLLAELYRTSNQSMPPQVIIPAGVELLMQAADFIRKSKLEPINNKVIGDSMDVMVTTVLQMFKLDPGKIVQFVDQQQGA
ncbi:MAG: hypothetical protein EBR88_02605 [Betaproteobacteria bacterium]|nr:hypothetical protein [Betaproteobacteria bacterium]